jgi:hypothetical protein
MAMPGNFRVDPSQAGQGILKAGEIARGGRAQGWIGRFCGYRFA